MSSREVENEMIVGSVTIWAYLPCNTIWREESERVQRLVRTLSFRTRMSGDGEIARVVAFRGLLGAR
jgi:hypothetical protein